MATLDDLLAAEALLRDARTTVSDLQPGDLILDHYPPVGDIFCTLSRRATVVSTRNTTPDRIHPKAWWSVTLLLADHTERTFECSAAFAVERAS